MKPLRTVKRGLMQVHVKINLKLGNLLLYIGGEAYGKAIPNSLGSLGKYSRSQIVRLLDLYDNDEVIVQCYLDAGRCTIELPNNEQVFIYNIGWPASTVAEFRTHLMKLSYLNEDEVLALTKN